MKDQLYGGRFACVARRVSVWAVSKPLSKAVFAVLLATQRLVCLALCHKFANVRAGLCLVLACAVQLAVITWHALRTPADEGVTRQAQCGGFHRVGGGKQQQGVRLSAGRWWL